MRGEPRTAKAYGRMSAGDMKRILRADEIGLDAGIDGTESRLLRLRNSGISKTGKKKLRKPGNDGRLILKYFEPLFVGVIAVIERSDWTGHTAAA